MPSRTASASPSVGRSPRASSRAVTTARTTVLGQLKDDHQRVKKAYREFQKLEKRGDATGMQAIVEQVCDELSLHAAMEEELLYPPARGAVTDEGLIDEAEVEHESMHAAIGQLQGMTPEDQKYSARFTVLCEYVMHHVKEEESEIFPQLEKAKFDWVSIAAQMAARRTEAAAGAAAERSSTENEDADPVGARSANGTRSRSRVSSSSLQRAASRRA